MKVYIVKEVKCFSGDAEVTMMAYATEELAMNHLADVKADILSIVDEAEECGNSFEREEGKTYYAAWLAGEWFEEHYEVSMEELEVIGA